MTDAEYEEQKQRIRAIADRWIEPLGLNWWKIELEYSREPLQGAEEDAKQGWCLQATCRAKWQYLDATITFGLPSIAHLSDEALEDVIVHELMHVFVNEMREKGINHEERVVTQLTKAVIGLRAHLRETPDGP